MCPFSECMSYSEALDYGCVALRSRDQKSKFFVFEGINGK